LERELKKRREITKEKRNRSSSSRTEYQGISAMTALVPDLA